MHLRRKKDPAKALRRGADIPRCQAYAPDLPGVVATGNTLEECEAAMREAIEFHIEGLRLAGESVPPATSHVAVVTVAA
jgi:predicted RNase H-like HicB family nuclease